jgi:hypothetical protein
MEMCGTEAEAAGCAGVEEGAAAAAARRLPPVVTKLRRVIWVLLKPDY